MNTARLDCVIIGYNELPFEQYECFLSKYGEDTEAYRDLQFSFVNLDGQKLDYLGLLNHVVRSVRAEDPSVKQAADFRSGDIPNLASVYLSSFLQRNGHRAKYVNLFQHEKDKLIAYLAEEPLCVAITTTFYVVNLPVSEIVAFIRSHNRNVKIVVGGPLIANHARNYSGESLKAALNDLGADIYVIDGAGEATLAAIVSCLKENGSLSKIPNLAYWEDGALVTTPSLPENNSLDANAIDWRDFDDQALGYTIQTRTARSCAFNCAFCNYPTRAGKLTVSNVGTVEGELDSIRALGYIKNVVFIDDTFNVPLPRFKELCRMMIKNAYGFNWFSYFRCSNSDEEAFDLMAESGCKGVFLGIESGSPTILKNMNKAASVEKYAEGIKQLHQRDILTFGSFIIGFPGETAETVDETLSFIKENKPNYYRAQSWYCEPGTPIDRHREKYGISGEGFVWQHATMDSLEAMDQIDRLFLNVTESLWLPQWSFDFWIIPYLLGRGISAGQFKEFMALADKMLAMEIAFVPAPEKRAMQQGTLQKMTQLVKGWQTI